VRAVLDVNVIISGLLSRSGAPADVLRALDDGVFEAVASPKLLAELARALAYPKLRRHIPQDDAAAILHWFATTATLLPDPSQPPPARSKDADDDYLIVLASAQRAALVSGDNHLLALAPAIPIFAPREFLGWLAWQ
jgi:putative PIN family toxin of toxin-antitoxin system